MGLYFVYLAGAAASGVWVYPDAKKHERANPRSLALGTAVLFPVGLLFYCQRPSKAAQVWPSKIAHLAEVTSL